MERCVGIAGAIFIAFLSHLYTLCIVPGAWAVPDYLPGWIYIDCGATADRSDNYTGVTWLPDAAFITTGVNYANISSPQTTFLDDYPELRTLRFFNDSRAKNCYSLPVTPNQTYLLRASFLYDASYDSAPRPPKFSMAIDGTIVANITVDPTGLTFEKPEFTVRSQNSIIFLCLTQNASLSDYGNPFISAISLRPGPENSSFSDYLAAGQFMMLEHRLSFGGNTTQRNPNRDTFDRWWSNEGLNTSYLLCTAPLQKLTTNQTINLWSYAAHNLVPEGLFQTALTTNGNMTIRFLNDGPADILAYMVLYFAELDPTLTNVGSREFYVHVPGYVDYDVNIYRLAGGLFSATSTTWAGFGFPVSSTINLYPSLTSQLGPLVSAMELYAITAPASVKTLDRDGLAIDAIKVNTSSLSVWTGDPCLPSPHPWVTCGTSDSSSHPVVVAVDLSGYQVGGTISSSFASLLDLTSLFLDNNSLTGSMPDLSVLTKLKVLHLQDNMLSGTLPDWLATLSHLTELFMENNNFSGDIPKNLLARTDINIRYSPGNTLLRNFKLQPPPPPPLPIMDITLGAILFVLGVVLILEVRYLSILFQKLRQQPRLRKGTRDWKFQKVERIIEHAHMIEKSMSSYEEVLLATMEPEKTTQGATEEKNGNENPDVQVLGTKVIVRRQCASDPVHNEKLLNEVYIYSRVHHRSLVSLKGYSRDPNGMLVLIYEEFFQNRSLEDYLKEQNPNLNWLTRLQIALNTSQGLNYLHTQCKLPIIHCDVRSANILVRDLSGRGATDNITAKEIAKFTNFGCSRETTDEKLNCKPVVGGDATQYLDPACVRNSRWVKECDVFNFGLVLLELITGTQPSELRDQQSDYRNWILDKAFLQGSLGSSDVQCIMPLLNLSKLSPLNMPTLCTKIKRVITQWIALLIMEDDGCSLTYAKVDKAVQEKRYEAILDSVLANSPPPAESVEIVLEIAIQCVQNDHLRRPQMNQVIKQLEFAKLVVDGEEACASSDTATASRHLSSAMASSSHKNMTSAMASSSHNNMTSDMASSSHNSGSCEIVPDHED